MKTFSIKTTDGNRYDFKEPACSEELVQRFVNSDSNVWLRIEDGSVARLFYKPNIVCVTIKEAEDA